jgi:hypothetical protein
MKPYAAVRMFKLACAYDVRLLPRDPDLRSVRQQAWIDDLADIESEELAARCVRDWFRERQDDSPPFNSAVLHELCLERAAAEEAALARERAARAARARPIVPKAPPTTNTRQWVESARASLAEAKGANERREQLN